MKISYESSKDLEKLVATAWGVPDPNYLDGLVDADRFESNPYDAVRLVVAPFVYNHNKVHNDGRVTSACEALNFIKNEQIEDADGCHTSLTASEELKLVQTVQNLYGYLKENY